MVSGRSSFSVTKLEYDLPQRLIAQSPAGQRAASRMMVVNATDGSITHDQFNDLPCYLPRETHMFLNNSRVIPARIRAQRETGGAVELLYSSWHGPGQARFLINSSRPLKTSEQLRTNAGLNITLLEPKQLDGSLASVTDETGLPLERHELYALLEKIGETPLPPYIKRTAGALPEDRQRYQTVYATEPGSIAAATAGLHFDEEMLDRLAGAGHRIDYITLHVGLGTFAPVRAADLADHEIHAEDFTVSPATFDAYQRTLKEQAPLLAVGTTVLRCLHSIHDEARKASASITAPLERETHAFIYPGHGTEAASMLLTNFHLPRSTLLALVYAFGGTELMRDAYRQAIAHEYRFFSYGDCMLIKR